MATFCLCMIVRDEAAVIERCLASVAPLIDSWVIVDTGSTDGTPELVRGALQMPGELHSRAWVDFGHNRTEALALARGRADYLLLLDADMTVEYDAARLGALDADAYLLRYAGPLEYWQKLLVRGDRDWRYVGSTHEYLTMTEPERVERLDTIVLHHHADGSSRAQKLERDLELLERDAAFDPNNPRTVFYLAQTKSDAGDVDGALELYIRRAEMGGWEEEVFHSLHQVGALHARRGDWPAALEALIRTWEFRPSRLEPLHELVVGLRTRKLWQTAHLFVLRGLNVPQPDDLLFVQPWIYRWGLAFELTITAYWVGDPYTSLATCDRLLSLDDLPAVYREQTLANRAFAQRAMARPGEARITLPPGR
jgi:tetratricopeptide (TPR) repeat protein